MAYVVVAVGLQIRREERREGFNVCSSQTQAEGMWECKGLSCKLGLRRPTLMLHELQRVFWPVTTRNARLQVFFSGRNAYGLPDDLTA